LDAARHDIQKYLKRERRKDVPAGADFWDFDCRLGTDPENAQTVSLAALTEGITLLAQQGVPQFYVEIFAKPGVRTPRPQGAGATAQGEADED
jgi:hypothetical protein